MSIVSVTPGNYTPGAQTALDMTASVINATWEQANIKTAAFEAKIDAIANDWLATANAPHVAAGATVAPNVEEPGVNIPQNVDVPDVLATFTTQYNELVAMLVAKFTAFQGTYFPQDQVDYNAAEAWLAAGLANESGLPQAVRDQIETDDHARLTAEANRADDALVAKFAGMRFPMPSGALASARLQLAQTKQDKMAESSRKITIASVEQLKWTVEKLIGLRQMAMSSAIEYIKALVSAPQISSTMVGVGYDAQSKLISAASQFYGVRADVAKIQAQSDQYNTTAALDAATKNQAADLQMIEDRLKALLTECQAFAQMATSMFNNLHANSGTGYNVSVS